MYSLMLVQVHSLERECFIQRDGRFTFIVMETGWWGHALHLLYFHLILHRRQDISSSIHTVQQPHSQDASQEEGCRFHTFILCVFRKVLQFACSAFPGYSREYGREFIFFIHYTIQMYEYCSVSRILMRCYYLSSQHCIQKTYTGLYSER